LDTEIEKVKKEYEEKQRLKREKRKKETGKEDEKANSDKVRTPSIYALIVWRLINNLCSSRNSPNQRMIRKSMLDLAYTL
jgi:hypothetical protein